jgi:HlyD family secretion protein
MVASLYERVRLFMRKYFFIAVFAIVALGGYFGVDAIFSTDIDIPTTRASKGEFIVALKESGSVDAKRAVTLSAPRIQGGGLQITWLAPEGSMVTKGDEVIKFDASKQTADLAEHESNLKIKRAALDRAKQEYTIQDKQLKLDFEKAKRNYDEKKHEAPRVAEEAKMELELAELNFKAKLGQLTSDVDKAQAEVDRAVDKVTLANRDLTMMTLTAPIPGLVVYMEVWKGGTMGKVQEGDSPWPGQGLVNLPDLNEMVVNTEVSEVDASKVDTGKLVEVRLDAAPDKMYQGRVTSKSTLARSKDHDSRINVFDVEVAVLESDDNLKPGMSATCSIILDRANDIVSVPIEAVFEKDGQTVVYTSGGKTKRITVGRKNDVAIEVTEGLNGDEEICLSDPTIDAPRLPGDRATEPEMNKAGSTATDRSKGGGSRGR